MVAANRLARLRSCGDLAFGPWSKAKDVVFRSSGSFGFTFHAKLLHATSDLYQRPRRQKHEELQFGFWLLDELPQEKMKKMPSVPEA